MATEQNKFEQAVKVDYSELVKKKGQNEYIPWASEWSLFKKSYPNGEFEFHENENGGYLFSEGDLGFMVKVSVWNGEEPNITHKLSLPIMDFKNKANMNFTVMEINKALFRCLAKCCAMHGPGLPIYAGEEYYLFEIGAELETARDKVVELAGKMSKLDARDKAIEIIGNGGKVAKIRTVEDANSVIEKMEEEIKKLETAKKEKPTKTTTNKEEK